MFVLLNNDIVNISCIKRIDLSKLEADGEARVEYTLHEGRYEATLRGPQAFDLVLRVCPHALEGKRLAFARHSWAVHNLVGHPAMQVLSWLGFVKLGIRLHDSTVPWNKITVRSP